MMCASKESVQSKRRQNGTSRGAHYSQSHVFEPSLKVRGAWKLSTGRIRLAFFSKQRRLCLLHLSRFSATASCAYCKFVLGNYTPRHDA